MKIKLFTHNDLDGVACAILAKLQFAEVDVDFCTYQDVDEKICKFLNDPVKVNEYDEIYITDISCNEKTAKLIDDSVAVTPIKLLDHHVTAGWLNKYGWANVTDSWLGNTTCGAELFYYDLSISAYTLNSFVRYVRLYDTWKWVELSENVPLMLNDLLQLFGKTEFMERMTTNLLRGIITTSEESNIWAIFNKQKNTYFKQKESELIPFKVHGYMMGVVFAEQHISELGHYLGKKHSLYDGIILISPNSVSYRTIHDHVDVSKIAKLHGGGGHKKAAGSPIGKFNTRVFLNDLFYEEVSEGETKL